ncbi:MAG: hypothetical protein ACE5EY_11400, partial [Anaerolineae bacterium]
VQPGSKYAQAAQLAVVLVRDDVIRVILVCFCKNALESGFRWRLMCDMAISRRVMTQRLRQHFPASKESGHHGANRTTE